MDWVTVAALAVILAGVLIRATFGFGEALIAMPVLTMLFGIPLAAPLVAMMSVTVAATILVTDWRHVHVRSAMQLFLSSLLGIPIGLHFVTEIPPPVVHAILAVVIISFSAYSLLTRESLAIKNDGIGYGFGFVAGVLGGAYNTPGPPLVIFGTLRKWSAEHFRATLQGFFLPTSLVILAGHGIKGRLGSEVLSLYLIALPVIAVGLIGGRKLNRKVRDRGFVRYVHGLLIVIGLSLLINTLRLLLRSA